jgi:hypothetical protein
VPICFGFLYIFLAATLYSKNSNISITTKEIQTYPHVASAEQAARIKKGYQQITAGMSPAEVITILGQPDEIRPLYESKIPNVNLIGYTHWYVLRRLADNGSANDQDASLVRISYDLNNRVMAVDQWGMGSYK